MMQYLTLCGFALTLAFDL